MKVGATRRKAPREGPPQRIETLQETPQETLQETPQEIPQEILRRALRDPSGEPSGDPRGLYQINLRLPICRRLRMLYSSLSVFVHIYIYMVYGIC